MSHLPFIAAKIKSVTIAEEGNPASCNHSDSVSMDFVTLDSWEEILDTPLCVGIVRAQDNMSARLAVAVLLSQHKYDYSEEDYQSRKGDASSLPRSDPTALVGCLGCLQNIMMETIEDWASKEIYIVS